MTRSTLLGICLLALLAAHAHADAVVLKSGKKFEGTVLSENDKSVVIKTAHGKLTLPRYQVKTIERGASKARTPTHVEPSGAASRRKAPGSSRSQMRTRKPADPAEVKRALGTLNGDSDATRRGNAARKLGSLGRNDPSIVASILPDLMKAATKDANMNTRREASTALLGLGRPAVDPLARMLVGQNAEQRRVAADALSKLRPLDVVDAVPVLMRALGDKSREVRMRVVATLGQMARDSGARREAGPKLLATALERALDDGDEMIRNQAAGHLGALGPAADLALAKARKDKSSMVRTTASKATLATTGSAKSLRDLIKQLGDPSAEMQGAAVDGISKLARGSKYAARDAIPVFEVIMNDTKRSKRVRLKALSGYSKVLKKFKDAAVAIVPKLEKTAAAHPELRKHIATGVAELCGKKAVPLLEKLALDKDPDVRKAAKATLKRVDPARGR